VVPAKVIGGAAIGGTQLAVPGSNRFFDKKTGCVFRELGY